MTCSKTAIHVQDDLWVEIFKRLPVKSILRFRCVCKSWSSLLSSPFFITYHHKFSLSDSRTNQESYLLWEQSARLTIQGYAVYHPSQCDAGGERITHVGFPFPIQNMENLWKFKSSYYKVIGVIHGVVCLATLDRDKAVIWNPATRRAIPFEFCKPEFDNDNHVIGFGFSAAKKDFKLVLHSGIGPHYDIFSVQDGLGRRRALPDHLCGDNVPLSNGCFVNGTIYWMASSKVDGLCSMLLFDCEREQFQIMELPSELGEFLSLLVRRLFVFNGKLSILRLVEPWGIHEVWVMEEGYGGIVGWRKLLKMNQHFNPLSLTDTDVMLGQDGNIVLLSREDLCKAELPYDCDWWHQPLSGHAFRESLYLTDVNSNAPPSSLKHQKPAPPPPPPDETLYIYNGYRSKLSLCFNLCLSVALKLLVDYCTD